MKKMVCEICESKKIKKENGVFVCQDCGTEYSLEEAKNLLIEIGDVSSIIDNKANKNIIMHQLISWYELILSFEEINIWLNINKGFLCDENECSKVKNNILKLSEAEKICLDEDYLLKVSQYERQGDTIKDYSAYSFLSKLSDGELKELINNREKLKTLYGYYPELLFFKDPEIERLKERVKTLQGLYILDGSIKPKQNSPILGRVNNFVDVVLALKNCETFYNKYKTYTAHPTLFGNTYYEYKDYGFVNYLERFSSIKKCLIERHQLLMNLINSNFSNMKNYYLSLFDTIDQLEQHLNIPYKYRNINDIVKLIEYFKNGRCENLREAINILESENLQNIIIKSIDEMKNIVIEVGVMIKNELRNINSSLLKINENIDEIKRNVNLCQEELKNIMYDTRYQLICNILN